MKRTFIIPAKPGDRETMAEAAKRNPDTWDADIQAISDWVITQTLCTINLQRLLDGFCTRLLDAGLPLARGHMAMGTLHPMYQAATFT